MITKQRTLFYFVGEQAFKSLEDAQEYDLSKLIDPKLRDMGTADQFPKNVAQHLLANSAEIVDILTTTPKSRLRGRKSHGATRKPRTPKTPPATP